MRYIDLGSVEPKFIQGLTEYLRTTSPKEDILVAGTYNKPVLAITGPYPLTKNQIARIDEMPKSFETVRYYIKSLQNCISIGQLSLRYARIKNPELEDKKNKLTIVDAIYSALKEHEIDIKEKRFFTGNHTPIGANALLSLMVIFLDFDKELANKLYGEKAKILRKTAGLYEVKPDISPNKLSLDIAKALAESTGVELKEDSLTSEELDKINALVSVLDNKEWIINGYLGTDKKLN